VPVAFATSIESIPADEWNALELRGNPTVSHEFLLALEQARCVGPHAGWSACHLALRDEHGALRGAMPLYRKTHSWGEFVFDFSWAQAYAQAGLRYYPKLVSMVPFTPAPGTRLLVRSSDPNAADTRGELVRQAIEFANAQQIATLHAHFVEPEDLDVLRDEGMLLRKDCQFHWFNRGYGSFDDFIATFRAEKRKKALRERRKIREAGVTFRTLRGEEMDAALWQVVFGFSTNTFAQRGNEHYLNTRFFEVLCAKKPGSVMVKLAEFDARPIAAAIFFVSSDTLYGRYWGALAQFDSLHFEACYYQGIDYCIEHGIARFEPGTQGEHKIARGFEPTATWSAHWIADERFRRALAHYLDQERQAIDNYMMEVKSHVPFHREASP
jgi:predicted N-acyltransferase